MADNGAPTPRRKRPEKPLDVLLAGGLPPQNLDAERMLLGCVLRDPFVLADLVRLIREDHFYSDKHKKIYRAMTELFDKSAVVDPVALGEQLQRNGELVDVGADLIAEIYEQTLTAANYAYYANLVLDKAVVRDLIRVGNEILRDAYESTAPADDLLAGAETKIFSIASSRSAGDAVEIGAVLQLAFKRLSERQSKDGQWTGGVPSGFADLDNYTNGFQDGELIVLAARPSIGKTSLAMNFVEHAAVDHKMPVLFISLEMSRLELAERLLCSRAGVNLQFLRKGRLSSDDTRRLIQGGDELGSAPIYIDDTAAQTMLRIAGTARRLKQKKGPGEGLRMIVVDYLQLIEGEDRQASRHEQISQISRRLKNLAKDVGVPVVALSQLNRGPEAREGHRPRMSDLRESGSIEQDADVVLLLHRDDAYDPTQNPGEADLIIAKQRNGPVGDVKLTFQKELTRFRDYAPNIPAFDAAAGEF
jgi:replicative DNA helicase